MEEEKAKSDHVDVSMTRDKGTKIRFDISVSPQGVQSAYEKAIKMINKEVSIPGFRKGKAPNDYIVKSYPKQIEKEWKEIVLQTGFNESLKLFKKRPFNSNTVSCKEIKEFSKENGAQFVIEFEAAPAVPRINPNEIHLEKIAPREVSPKEVEEGLDALRFQFAHWEEIKDRPIQEQDFVELDLERLDEPQEQICSDTRFEVGKMAPWMKNLLIGTNLNESVEGTSEPDPNQGQNEEGFIPTKCRITVKKILSAAPATLDDTLAKKTGVANLESLREAVKKYLSQKALQESYEIMHNQLDSILLEKYPFDIPLSSVNEAAKNRIEEITSQEQPPKEELEKLEQILPAQIEKSYKLYYLLSAFAHMHQIAPTNEEISHELTAFMMRNPGLSNEIQKEYGERISQHILLQKSRDYIIEQAIKNKAKTS